MILPRPKITRIKDKWGLPRPWRFWRDWVFWLYVCFDLNLIVVFVSLIVKGSLMNLELWVILLIFTLALLQLGPKWWVQYDSYVWEMPERITHCLVTLWCWPIGFGMYVQKRPEWLQEIVDRQDKLI